MSDHVMLARIYSLVAQMEAIKVRVAMLQAEGNTLEENYLKAEEEINGIVYELEMIGR